MKKVFITTFTIIFILIFNNFVYATPPAKVLLEEMIKLVARIIVALGTLYGILGVVHYAEANSDGDGPAKKKAMAQMASGVMIISLSIALNASAGTIAQMVAYVS